MKLIRSMFQIGLVFAMAVVSSGSSGYCGDSSYEILKRADRARGNLDGVQWHVSAFALEDNVKYERELTVKARGYDFLALMISPPKMKGQKLLMIDHNMWFTKPGVKKPVPVSSRQKLVGGSVYGDLAATNYAEDYDAAFLPEESIHGDICYVFDLTAKTKKATYDRIKYWVSKSQGVGVKAEYYTVSGKLFKTAVFEYNNQVTVNSMVDPFISKITFTDALVKTNVTDFYFNDTKLVALPDSVFDLNLLQNSV